MSGYKKPENYYAPQYVAWSKHDIPKSFKWGAGLSAYQAEGATSTDGRGPSIWDVFPSHKIKDLSNADRSCDFYNRYENDLFLLKWLGLNHFKTSISWSRILPEGTGKTNRKGIGFYDKLIDQLLEVGIEPWMVLYHWDLPLALQKVGGWKNRAILHSFEKYVQVCHNHFGDRVQHWITINEPFVFVGAGHFLGLHAPGESSLASFLASAHHVNLANSLSISLLKSLGAQQVGPAMSFTSIHSADKREQNIKARDRVHQLVNHLFLDPLIGKGYPTKELTFLKRMEKYVKPDDLENMHVDFDFLGVQVYTREVVKHSALTPNLKAKIIPPAKRNSKVSSLGQEVYPYALKEILRWLVPHLDNPSTDLYITECGISKPEVVLKNSINDSYRIEYYQHVLDSIRPYIANETVKGLFFWSLLDNFEWAEGFTAPFGLFHVDFDTMVRNPKQSAYWVRQLMRSKQFQ